MITIYLIKATVTFIVHHDAIQITNIPISVVVVMKNLLPIVPDLLVADHQTHDQHCEECNWCDSDDNEEVDHHIGEGVWHYTTAVVYNATVVHHRHYAFHK